jgi:predicted component of type VI protein secretion system
VKTELVPTNGDAPIPITKDVTVVGRREFCDIRIDHPSLSKRHCVLVRTDGLLMIRDLATTNGTKVNGQRIMWAALLPNDRLTLGKYKVRVYLGSDEAPSPSEQRGRPAAAGKPRAGLQPAASPPMAAPPPFAPVTVMEPLVAHADAVPELIGPDDLILDELDDGLEILSD